MKTVALTHIGFVREKNEDRYLIKELTDGSLLLAVADGMGGEVAGDYAAELIIKKIGHRQPHPLKNDWQLSQLVKEADRSVYNEVKNNSALAGMGSTVTCALLRNDLLIWAHVGDSRLFVQRNQELIQLTKDQNMAQFLLDEGEITAEEARHHPFQNQLDQCVGCGECNPDRGHLEIESEKLVMLTTDGLHSEVPAETISSLLAIPTDIETKAESLIKAALDAGGKDNITVLIAEL